MKKNSKHRLFEVMARLDKTFKPKLNESTDLDKYEDVVFMQGDDAHKALTILDVGGEEAALKYLKQWHEPGSHMGSNELGHGSGDETYEKDGYIMSWNTRMGYIGLQYDLSYMNENVSKEPFRNLKYEKATQTIRTVPENYWIASVKDDGAIVFDSWDGAIKGRVDKDYVIDWFNKNIKNVNENIYKDDDPTSRAFRDFAKASDPEGYKRRWEKERPGEVEPEKEKPKAMNQFKKDLNKKDLNIGRRFKVNPKYTHFAVFKDSNKIATAWEYGHIEPEELRSEKKTYFYDDLVDWDIEPKSVNILSKKYLERKGINPFDWNNWETNEERDVRTGLESA